MGFEPITKSGGEKGRVMREEGAQRVGSRGAGSRRREIG